MNIKKK